MFMCFEEKDCGLSIKYSLHVAGLHHQKYASHVNISPTLKKTLLFLHEPIVVHYLFCFRNKY